MGWMWKGRQPKSTLRQNYSDAVTLYVRSQADPQQILRLAVREG